MGVGLSPLPIAALCLSPLAAAADPGGRPVLLLGVTPWRGDPAWRARWAAMWPRLATRHDALLVPDL